MNCAPPLKIIAPETMHIIEVQSQLCQTKHIQYPLVLNFGLLLGFSLCLWWCSCLQISKICCGKHRSCSAIQKRPFAELRRAMFTLLQSSSSRFSPDRALSVTTKNMDSNLKVYFSSHLEATLNRLATVTFSSLMNCLLLFFFFSHFLHPFRMSYIVTLLLLMTQVPLK